MKTIIYKSLILFVVMLTMVGCKSDDMEYHDPGVNPVEALYAPINNQILKLSSEPTASLLFQWSPGYAQDGQAVIYEVVFYKASDKENPVYRIPAVEPGRPYLTISHIDINKACAMAGIPTGETGSVFWSVVSWRGVSSAACTQKNELIVTRLEGFEVIPENVYITGTGSEAGTELSNAIIMQKIEAGKFEIYTELDSDGEFFFVDRLTVDAERYYIDSDGNFTDANNNETSTIDTKGVYRITLDFTNKGLTVTKITKMGLWFCPSNAVTIDMAYVGLGVWSGTGDVEFKQEGWGRDQRYKFQLETDKGTMQIGTLNGTDSDPNADSPASYYYVKLLDRVDQWDDKWKFAAEMDMANVTIALHMQGGAPYTHTVKKN